MLSGKKQSDPQILNPKSSAPNGSSNGSKRLEDYLVKRLRMVGNTWSNGFPRLGIDCQPLTFKGGTEKGVGGDGCWWGGQVRDGRGGVSVLFPFFQVPLGLLEALPTITF